MKPYRSYNDSLQAEFGCRVSKIPLEAGFDCPNRDGAKGEGGCTFCDPTGSSARVQSRFNSITQQIQTQIAFHQKRYKSKKFLAYFQAFSNTYAPVERLKALYDEALAAHPDIVGLSISTRPDCVDEEKLALIASYQQPGRHVMVEYGMQTIHNRTLAAVNRCETHADFCQALALTKQYGLHHGVHVILGMPGETWADQMATADRLAELRVDGVKIHLLVAMKGTPIAQAYERGEWTPLAFDDYIPLVCDFIERLHPECILHRVGGNGHPKFVVAPRWMPEERERVLQAIEEEFLRRGTRQGSRYSLSNTARTGEASNSISLSGSATSV